jgi:hypothetical protein
VAATARLGIYAHDHATRLPGSLIVEGGSDLDVSTSLAATGPLAQITDLDPGIYWLASCFSAICGPAQIPASYMAGGIGWMWGGTSADALLSGSASAAVTRYTRDAALTYSAGNPFFPSDFGPGSFGLNTPGSPLIAWRPE